MRAVLRQSLPNTTGTIRHSTLHISSSYVGKQQLRLATKKLSQPFVFIVNSSSESPVDLPCRFSLCLRHLRRRLCGTLHADVGP